EDARDVSRHVVLPRPARYGSANTLKGIGCEPMRRISFNDGWEVRPKANRMDELSGEAAEWAPVTLPHDAMIGTERSPAAAGANAYFPGGVWEYQKRFELPADSSSTTVLEFEGVYRDAVVVVNDAVAAQRPYG